jgi:hypothetical protein
MRIAVRLGKRARIAAVGTKALVAACGVAAFLLPPLAASQDGGRVDARSRDHGFGLLIGGCIWKPPSPAAAIEAVLYFFGIGVGTSGEAFVHDFHVLLKGQYLAAGFTEERASREVLAFDQCVASYVPEDQKKDDRRLTK